MTNTPHPAKTAPQPDDADPQSEAMRDADTVNGESPDSDESKPSTTHRTGVRQARENAENDPPA